MILITVSWKEAEQLVNIFFAEGPGFVSRALLSKVTC